MGSGDLTASTPVGVNLNDSGLALKTQIDLLNLAATTDRLVVIPQNNGNAAIVFKVEREA